MVAIDAQQKFWAKIIAKAWEDENYKTRLLADPATVLSEEGLTVPPGVEVKIVEETKKLAWLVLPVQPQGDVTHAEERLATAQTIF